MFASLQRQEAAPAYLDGAGDPYHVLGAAWRGGAGRRPPAPLSEARSVRRMRRGDVFAA